MSPFPLYSYRLINLGSVDVNLIAMPITLEITYLNHTVQDRPRLQELTNPGPSVFKNWLDGTDPVRVVLARSDESILGWMGCDRYGVIGWFVDPRFRHLGIATKMTKLISELGLLDSYLNAQPNDPVVYTNCSPKLVTGRFMTEGGTC